MDWWSNLRLDYEKISTTASEESPPSIATLLKGILDSTSAADRSYLDQAVAIASPNLPEAFVTRLSGAALFDMGFIDEGIQIMQRAVVLDHTIDSKDYLAVRLQRIDRVEESHVLYNKMLIQEPENLHALIGVAQTYNQLDDLKSSLRVYKKGVSLYPENVRLREGMASVLVMLGEYEQSMDEIEKLRSLGVVDNANMMNILALCYWYGMGDAQLALEYINKTLALQPDSTASLNLRKTILDADL